MIASNHKQQSKRDYFIWYLFIPIVLLDFYLFRHYFLLNIDGYYSIAHDQTDYLKMAYRLYENINQYGWSTGLKKSDMLPTGALFPIQAVGLFFLAEPSRFFALLPNFIYFIALQCVLLFTVKSLTNQRHLPILFLGLILCIQLPFNKAGGLMDFRMDFIAFCMYGIFTCCTIKSELFRDRSWSLITAFVISLMTLQRFITLIYISSILGILFLYFLYRLNNKNISTIQHAHIKSQFINLVLICAIVAAVMFPYIWINKESIFQYYVVNHVINEKGYRLVEAHIQNTFDYLIYYPASLIYHLGKFALISIALLFLPLFYQPQRLSLNPTPQYHSSITANREILFFILLCIIVPLTILTIDPNKSAVAGSIMVVPFLWLVFWLYLYLFNLNTQKTNKIGLWQTSVVMIVLLLGIYNQTHELLRQKNKRNLHDLSTITTMYVDIGAYALQNKWPIVRLSTDHIQDYLTATHVEVLNFEKRRQLIRAEPQPLGSTNYGITLDNAINSLKNSNVVIFNLGNYKPGAPYPFNNMIGEFKPQLFDYINQHFRILGDYQFMNYTMRVYVK